MPELILRLVCSLAVVVGLLLLLARFGAKRFKGGQGSLIRVVHRQPLSRTSAVAVVAVGSRVLVLGTTEQQITVLAELDPEELVTEEEVSRALNAAGTGAPMPVDTTRGDVTAPGALSGSIFSVSTWKQALAAIRSKKDLS